jgi:4-hydroxybutyrate CoA-transferase
MIRRMKGSLDVFLGHVSPPDKNGFCSFGVSVDYERAAMETAALKIVQVNDQMPRALGDSFVHVSEIDFFVEHSAPIIELGRPTLTEVEKAIGRNCASLIRDGDTLQLGIGSLPDAVLLFLKDKKDLGIHSEMISDGVMELMKAGVITNRRKNYHTGKAVLTFAMGSREFYEFMDDNPVFQVMGADYVNDPYVIGKNDNMVSINSSVEVDFTGQICSESVGPKQISGTGGQVDFIRGATLSKGGKSIIAISSTAQGGKKSKIVPCFAAGTVVTCGRCEPDYIVTEYGIAYLKGKCVRQRAKDLIKIAHPDFREELAAAWEDMFKMKLDRAEIQP